MLTSDAADVAKPEGWTPLAWSFLGSGFMTVTNSQTITSFLVTNLILVDGVLLPCLVFRPIVWPIPCTGMALDFYTEFVVYRSRYQISHHCNSMCSLLVSGIIMGFPTTLSMNLVSQSEWTQQNSPTDPDL